MTTNAPSPILSRLGERLREARLNARITVRDAAERIGLNSHGTLVQYEQGKVLPPLERLAALAQIYDVPVASFLVTHDALAPVVTLLERASASQIHALIALLQRTILDSEHGD